MEFLSLRVFFFTFSLSALLETIQREWRIFENGNDTTSRFVHHHAFAASAAAATIENEAEEEEEDEATMVVV